MPEKITLMGQEFGHLKVLKESSTKNGRTQWLCQCVCGKMRIVATDSLRRGATKGCGSCGKIKHGLEGTPIYRLWSHIRERCYSKHHKDYPNYGGRGIVMGSGWENDVLKFESDLSETIGEKPGPNYSIDRIDNDGNYEVGNVRWATRSQQQLNKRANTSVDEFKGVKVSGSKFRAIIRDGKKIKAIGTFLTKEAAARAWDKKAFQIHGHNARLNFPDQIHLHDTWNSETEAEYSSKYRGVNFQGGKYLARVGVGTERHIVGLFATEEEAARAYDAKLTELGRDKAQRNFPE